MSSLLFDYTNDLISTLLGGHVDEHVGMILGDDAIHRERERVRVRELIECRHRALGQVFIVTTRSRNWGALRRRLPSRPKEPDRKVAYLLALDRRYATPEDRPSAVGKKIRRAQSEERVC